jgi:hypothetical protein
MQCYPELTECCSSVLLLFVVFFICLYCFSVISCSFMSVQRFTQRSGLMAQYLCLSRETVAQNGRSMMQQVEETILQTSLSVVMQADYMLSWQRISLCSCYVNTSRSGSRLITGRMHVSCCTSSVELGCGVSPECHRKSMIFNDTDS